MTAATYRLHFPHLDREIAARENETIFQSARRHGVRIVGACGGRGTCGSCVVRIGEGEVTKLQSPGAASEDLYENQGESSDRRKWLRACQIAARSDCSVEVAPRSLAPVVRTETDRGEKEMLPLDAAVVALDPLDCGDLRIDLAAARQLPSVLREGQGSGAWSLRVWRHGGELIGFGPAGRRSLGLAIDLGTTNAAGFLVDLESGERIATLGIENPQVAWGADLISRVNYAAQGDAAADELRGAAIEAINALAHDLCRSVDQAANDIMDVAICGNTAMHHLLLGLPVRQLGRAPFVAAVRGAMDLKARELGLAVAPGARVHIAPNIGGFVGGDHVTALLATESEWQGLGTALVMDIGTNTEITLIHDGRFYSASAPSGPALEGGHISCGMRAAEGAIEKVAYTGGRLTVETIGHKKAIGLCGSGVLDTLATLHRAGLVNDQGRLAAVHPDIVSQPGKSGGKRAVQLAPDVLFTQDDVRAVQLAKAAIRTAVDLLLDEAGAGVGEANIERFIIAGSFGAYIDIESGIRIGLFPDLPRERFLQVGNAAGIGVRRMLASGQARLRARQLADTCRYMELSSRGDFQKIFLHHIGFKKSPIEESGK
ncbi:MAG: ASKHA domain-containing protein [Proteobacteria bacterium]|nr:ASKHA domain-containing protein [Pseudomonadota bacterium]